MAMGTALIWDRLHFAFTVTFHYLFPQLTMGLGFLIFLLMTMAVRTGNDHYKRAAAFWTKIFAISFAAGVVTGIPMEFQFGTNWSGFSQYSGGIIGQTLAMEGVFAFFLESVFLGLFLLGEKKIGTRLLWFSSLMVFLGSWISGFFIIATNAFMQHPVGHVVGADGNLELRSLGALLSNPWLPWQYLHNMSGSVITASVVVAGIGALYLLLGRHQEYGRTFVRLGVITGVIASCFQLFPSGDAQGRNVARYQPTTLAGMEGLFESRHGAPIVIVGQPDMDELRLDNPISVPRALSLLTYRRWTAEVQGLKAFPREDWPDNVPLLYYSYHIMVGLGTIFVAGLVLAAWKLWRGSLFDSRRMLWVLVLLIPFPYIANTAGWLTAELGRQPWLVHGLQRTAAGYSPHVSAGNVLFTLIGFLGTYLVLGILFLFLVYRELDHGPDAAPDVVTTTAEAAPTSGTT